MDNKRLVFMNTSLYKNVKKQAERLPGKYVPIIVLAFVTYLLLININMVLYVRHTYINYVLNEVQEHIRTISCISDQEEKDNALKILEESFPGVAYKITDRKGALGAGLSTEMDTVGYGARIKKAKTGKYIVFVSKLREDTYLSGNIPIKAIIKKAEKLQLVLSVQTACMIAAVMMTGVMMTILRKRITRMIEDESKQKHKEEVDKAKDDFIANISHEIRTPINAILGLNEMIRRESRENDIKKYATDVAEAGEQLLSLVNDILDYSKIESGNMQIVESRYDLRNMLTGICKVIGIRAKLKGLEFETNIDPTIPVYLKGDRVHIRQVLFNLLTNAVKYTEEGRITFGVWHQIDLGNKDRILLNVSVKDTGIGIKREDTETIFNKFSRSDTVEKTDIEGTGLGLSITKELVQKMGGEIHVTSEYKKGSLFTIYVPQMIDKTGQNELIGNIEDYLKEKQADEKLFTAENARIIVVDDTEMNLRVIENLLKRTKIQITTATSGKDALAKFETGQMYNVALFDMRMPDMSGEELLNRLKGLYKDLCPVICLTGNTGEGVEESLLSKGFSGYIPKPIRPEMLEATILRFLPDDMVTYIDKSEETDEDDADIPEWIKKNSEIDVKEGIRFCGSGKDFMEAVKLFVRHAQDNITEIRNSLTNREFENFSIKVHALKSTARTVGAERLSVLAEKLEMASEKGDEVFIKDHIGGLLSLYGEITQSLSPVMYGEETQKKGILIEAENVRPLMGHLKGYVDDYNDEAVNSMLHALNQYDFPPREQKLFDELKKAFELIDWLKMQELLEEYEGNADE